MGKGLRVGGGPPSPNRGHKSKAKVKRLRSFSRSSSLSDDKVSHCCIGPSPFHLSFCLLCRGTQKYSEFATSVSVSTNANALLTTPSKLQMLA